MINPTDMIKKHILAATIALLALNSCYDDKSTLPVNTIDDVVLEATEDERNIRIGYLEQLDLAPKLSKGGKALDNDNFTYHWEMNIVPLKQEYETLGTEKELHAVITNQINTNSYILKLTVHDIAEDLDYLFNWNVFVETAFLDGLIVSDTRDGSTSDLTLILNDKLTMNYAKSEVIHRNILTTATGEPYPSLLTSLTPFLLGYINGTHTNYLFAVDSDRHLVRFDCQDFSVADGKDVVYYYDDEKVRGIFSVGPNVFNSDHYLLTTHGVYYTGVNGSDFIVPLNTTLSTSAPKDNVFAFKTHDASTDYWGGECTAVWVDDVTGKMTVMNAGFQGGSYEELQEGENSPYSCGDLGLQQVLCGGMTGSGVTPSLLAKEADGTYAIYTVNKKVTTYYDEEWDYSYDVTSYHPGQHIEAPADVASRLSAAVATELTDENYVLYIATPTEVSAALYGTGTMLDAGTKFTPDAGETITSIKVYRQGVWYYSSGLLTEYNADAGRPRLDLTSRALIVTTQSGDEGHVYVVPMTQLGTGNLDRASAMKWSGFGRILDVGTTGY